MAESQNNVTKSSNILSRTENQNLVDVLKTKRTRKEVKNVPQKKVKLNSPKAASEDEVQDEIVDERTSIAGSSEYFYKFMTERRQISQDLLEQMETIKKTFEMIQEKNKILEEQLFIDKKVLTTTKALGKVIQETINDIHAIIN